MALMFAGLAWSALSDLLSPLPLPTLVEPRPPTRSEQAWSFGILLVIALFMLRSSGILVFAAVTGREGRFRLVPWWFAWLFVIGLGCVALVFTVLGLWERDARGIRAGLRIGGLATLLAIPAYGLRRSQISKRRSRDSLALGRVNDDPP